MAISRSTRACLHFLYVTPLLILTILLFGATLVLGIIGIARAAESNPCVDNADNNTACTIQAPLIINGTVDDTENINEFTYWLAGATGCSVLFAIIATFGLWALEDALRRLRKAPKKKPTAKKDDQEAIEMETKGGDSSRSPTPPPKGKHLDIIDEFELLEKFPSELRKMNVGAVVALFFSCLCFSLSVVCFLWAIAVGINHSSREDRTVTPFVIVELLVAIAFPFLFVASVVIMANVVDFLTLGQADARAALPRFLCSVKFKKGQKYDFWVIEDNFYFQLEKRKDRADHGFCYSCYPNFSTWVLVGIVSLSINLAFSYFFDITLDMQVSVTTCDDDRIDRTFSCFNSSSLAFIDCINDTNVELIHCFKFFRIGVDTNIIQAFSTAFAFYLFTTRVLFGHVFLILKVFLHLSHRKVWGALVVIVGVLMFIGSVIIIVIWLTGYISAAQPELARLNVINLGQFVMMSLFVVLIGLLMVGGTWAEKEKMKQS